MYAVVDWKNYYISQLAYWQYCGYSVHIATILSQPMSQQNFHNFHISFDWISLCDNI